ncbi:hypothetical protein [Halomicrococcus sp. NG-SE-24]|uniref:hypothetical protein n=1 Tax=Halomicrococcus sp. NG-SE-24 TaxID=3436928 RepID=UPI003D9546F4
MIDALDWSSRYLALAISSVAATMLAWMVERELVVPLALATAAAFATLALLHARASERRLRKVNPDP